MDAVRTGPANRRSSALTREMFRQQAAGLLHAMDDARREFGFAKVAGHGIRQLPPEFVPALRMNPGIANHRKLMRTRRHKNQNAIPFRRLVQAQAHEFHLRGGDGVVNMLGSDADVDTAGRFLLGVANCRNNPVMLQVFGKMFWVHNLPAPSRAAAAKTAAAATEATTGKTAAARKSTAAPSA